MHPYRHWFSDTRIITPWVLALVGVVAVVIARCGVDVPVADEWTFIWLYREIHAGHIPLEFLFGQHNEHRMLVPRLVMTASAFLSGFNMKANMYLALVLAVIQYYLLARLARDQARSDPGYLALAHALVAILLLSLIHHEVWLYGINMMWFVANLFLVAGIWALYREGGRSPLLRMGLAVLCSVFAMLTAAHGALVWLALLPLVLRLPGSSRQRWWRAGGWLGLFGISLALYLQGYHTPHGHPDPLLALRAPQLGLVGFLAVLGAPLLHTNVALAALAGLVPALAYFHFVLRAWRRGSWQDEAPWFALGLYALLFAGATTVGRIGFGLDYALTGRYLLTSVILWVAVIYLARLALAQTTPAVPGGVGRSATVSFAAGGLLCFLLAGSFHAMAAVQQTHRHNVYLRACYRLAHYVPDRSLLQLYPDVSVVRKRVQMLEDMGYTGIARDIPRVPDPDLFYGVIDQPQQERRVVINRNVAGFSVSGWAALPKKWRQADIVLFSIEGHTGRFFHSAPVDQQSPDLVAALGSGRLARSRWATRIPLDRLPDGDSRIHAWTWDPQAKLLVRLGGEINVTVLPRAAGPGDGSGTLP
jgi:hypothetical protein